MPKIEIVRDQDYIIFYDTYTKKFGVDGPEGAGMAECQTQEEAEATIKRLKAKATRDSKIGFPKPAYQVTYHALILGQITSLEEKAAWFTWAERGRKERRKVDLVSYDGKCHTLFWKTPANDAIVAQIGEISIQITLLQEQRDKLSNSLDSPVTGE